MTDFQIFAFVVSIVLVLGIAGLAQLKWLPSGPRLKFALIFIAGAGAFAALWAAGLPPSWWSASRVGFGLAGSFVIGGAIGGNTPEREFRRPFLLGIGLTLLVANLVRAVMDGL